MSGKHTIIFKNENMQLSQGIDGYWLYDYIQGMNLSMKAKTEQEAFVKALTYYQKRYKESKIRYDELHNNVSNFIESLSKEDFMEVLSTEDSE